MSLTSISIPESVVSMESDAFHGCTGLEKVEFASVESMCKIQFEYEQTNPLYYAHNLYIDGEEVCDLILPETITAIGQYTFEGGSGLKTVIMPKSIESVDMSAFNECTGIRFFVFQGNKTPTKVEGRFGENSLNIPGDIVVPLGSKDDYSGWGKNIVEGFFADGRCYEMEADGGVSLVYLFDKVEGHFDIPSEVTHEGLNFNVTSIGRMLFASHTSLTSVSIPESITSIGMGAFAACTSLPQIILPDSVISIGSSAFAGCTGLSSFTLPSGITSIEPYLFKGCSNLKSVIIPQGLVSIGDRAFYECKSLSSIDIPNSVSSIGTYSFWCCESLTSIDIPESVDSIGFSTFEGCEALVHVGLPTNLRTISSWLFNCCRNLTSIQLPEALSFIETAAFANCDKLASIVIPANVDKIEHWAFKNDPNLCVVYCLGEQPAYIDYYDTFDNECYENSTLYVPMGCKDVYQEAYGWREFKNIIGFDPTRIDELRTDKTQSEGSEVVYDMKGRKLSQLQKGISIVRKADGTTKKIMVK